MERERAYVRDIPNGIVLPQRSGVLIWGEGGCIDESGNLVEESCVRGAFGGIYRWNKNDLEVIHTSVIYIPIIPNHWGHFLIDVVSRLYVLLDSDYYRNGMKILYSSWRFPAGRIDGNFLRFFQLMGIAESQMVHVDHPIKADHIYIPKETLGYAKLISDKYRMPVAKVVQAVNNLHENKKKRHPKIYFTRTGLASSRHKEIGEKEIESLFRLNGFKIVSPERLPLEEQIYYWQTCDIIAGLSGTIPHNVVFSHPGLILIILNRTSIENPPQLLLNSIFKDVNVVFLNAYKALTKKHPSDYGYGPFWVGINEEIDEYCDLHQWKHYHSSKVIESVNFFKYYILLIYHRVSRNKITIKVYRRLNKIWTLSQNR